MAKHVWIRIELIDLNNHAQNRSVYIISTLYQVIADHADSGKCITPHYEKSLSSSIQHNTATWPVNKTNVFFLFCSLVNSKVTDPIHIQD